MNKLSIKNILVFIGLTVGLLSYADNGQLHLDMKEFSHEGDSVYLTLIMDAHGMDLKSQQSLSLIPVLSDGENERILSFVELKGSSAYKAYKRQMELMSKRQKDNYATSAPYAVINVDNNTYELNYSLVWPYETWMSNARLEIRIDECGCGASGVGLDRVGGLNGEDRITDNNIIANYEQEQELFSNIAPALAIIKPEVETVKERSEEIECFLDFETNKYQIRPEYMRNPQELDNIKNLLLSLNNESGVVVEEVKIEGFASPEGQLKTNEMLSIKRAEALKDYLVNKSTLSSEMYTVLYGGENWAGLYSAISRSSLDYKNEVLDILQSNISTEEMKNKLKGIDNGKSYKSMVDSIYNKLRVAKCVVKYSVKNYTLDEIKVVMNDNPKNLSLNEMYLLATTYTPDSDEYANVFNVAVRYFPNDAIANINAAACALMRKSIVEAEFYLNKVKIRSRIPEYDNCMGVLEALKGNKDLAVEYFTAAAQSGLEEAKSNLSNIE